jgi:hypothetical protein
MPGIGAGDESEAKLRMSGRLSKSAKAVTLNR